MLLVYTHKITPRLTYIFKQLFVRMLHLPIEFTTTIEVFVAHSGPKISYTQAPLGDAFFVAAHNLLFEQGVQEQLIEMDEWEGLPIFFKTSPHSKIPFDLFAAAFYLITRYEEGLPHIKNKEGHFDPSQSLAGINHFLELPVIDCWVKQFYGDLIQAFPQLPPLGAPKVKRSLLFDIALPFQYLHHSLLSNLGLFLRALAAFDFYKIYEQLSVLLRLRSDPYNTFEFIKKRCLQNGWKPTFFFLFSKSSPFETTISIYNNAYHDLMKSVSDYFKVSALVSVKSQHRLFEALPEELKYLEKEIHREIKTVRMSQGIISVSELYSALTEMEIEEDYSMGYATVMGYRAGTATPYYHYDLSHELQSPLRIYPVVASAWVLKNMTPAAAFSKLEKLYTALPLSSCQHIFAMTNALLKKNKSEKSWNKAFEAYINKHEITS